MNTTIFEFNCPKCDADYLRYKSEMTPCPKCGENMNLVNTSSMDELFEDWYGM